MNIVRCKNSGVISVITKYTFWYKVNIGCFWFLKFYSDVKFNITKREAKTICNSLMVMTILIFKQKNNSIISNFLNIIKMNKPKFCLLLNGYTF